MNTPGGNIDDEDWNEYPENETSEEQKARLMLENGEMNHGIPRKKRAEIISSAGKILSGDWGREDYTD